MNLDSELMEEISKAKSEKEIIKRELEQSKNSFINYLMENGGNEIQEFDFKKQNQPVVYHKPFKMKVKDFIKRINKVIGL